MDSQDNVVSLDNRDNLDQGEKSVRSFYYYSIDANIYNNNISLSFFN